MAGASHEPDHPHTFFQQKFLTVPTRQAFLTVFEGAPTMLHLWLGQSGPLWGPGMDKKRLDYYRKKLVVRREELLKNIARTEEEGRAADDDPTVDLADKAANSYTKEFLFGQTNHDRISLQLVDEDADA